MRQRRQTSVWTSSTSIGEPVRLRVTEEHHVVRARQATVELAETIGFGGVGTAYVVTSVSELATNLVFHTLRGGTLTIVPVQRHGVIGLEVIAEDEGPGIPDISRAMQDGFSTKGGLGSGLPGVQRLMDEFEITSAVGIGTRIITRKWQSCR